ncbi:peptide chain release factor N(5)-glutamine methyltransferase [Ruminococcus sp. 210702-SL.1.03]|uniref:peptide chain release factor N(5)-glutamine methyltransferase n=1 Tax=Ruminococcus sp. 210702-SL.1.03 TaxID=2883233 RepID=UPI001D097625|nr:peptide chain release factor N(5)-glutamine methyltransferase [Ruminococcus sp. 210702-SL.1.03]MCB6615967.1 peptide chain release factor N(5)-glutamine methyltransferase [Ruminococcus sp. 210702-SL.1.03]
MVNYTYRDIIQSLSEKLTEAGISNAYWEARELAGAALGFNCRGKFDAKTQADTEQIKLCANLLARRLMGEPLQYIIGKWDFCGESFKVGSGVLIPRADTETLIECACSLLGGEKELTVIDLCSGSGCIGITLEKKLDCKEVWCVEKSEAAMYFLKENATRLNSACKPLLGDVTDESLPEKLPLADLIISNPPYISAADMKKLQKEVTFEPVEALFGGEDGCDFYREIVRLWKSRLKPEGIMMFEIGAGQEDEVMQIMIQAGMHDVRARRDMAGINRCVYGRNSVQKNEAVNLYDQLDKAERNLH